jgi:hypothetical protein
VQIIKHRCNSIDDLGTIQQSWGVEIDVRSNPAKSGLFFLGHDPWTCTQDFETWLRAFKQKEIRGPIIVNTKEDAIEGPIEELFQKLGLSNFLFLDTAVPTLRRRIFKESKLNHMIRFSSLERFEFLSNFSHKNLWCWVDCFDGIPLPPVDLEKVRKLGFKICLVAPELHSVLGVTPLFVQLKALADAVCTKIPKDWES